MQPFSGAFKGVVDKHLVNNSDDALGETESLLLSVGLAGLRE